MTIEFKIKKRKNRLHTLVALVGSNTFSIYSAAEGFGYAFSSATLFNHSGTTVGTGRAGFPSGTS